ncbi:MAG: alpha-amylase family glycosyl hydrolase [Polyangiales bacterium]
MKTRTTAAAVALAASGALGCWTELYDYSGPDIPLTSNVTDWRDEVIYQLLVDRFEDGDTSNDVRIDRNALGRYQGGDWQGVINRMPYLKQLGVTTIWISPIVRNVDTDAGFDAYHGYWASDLTLLNPHFGDLATARRMVQVAHDNGIKVILDIVTNHMGQMFFYDVNNNGRPDDFIEGSGPDYPYRNPGGLGSTLRRVTEYDPDFNARGPVQGFTSLGPAGDAPVIFLNMPDIFRVPPRSDLVASQAVLARPEGYHRRGRITAYDNVDSQPGAQVLLGDFPGGLKDVNTENPAVRDAMVEAYWRWVRLLDLDGFRIDTLKHVEHGFWQNFASRIRTLARAAGKRNFFMFGEAFDGDDRLVGSYTNPNEMDSVFYFPQKYRVFDNIFQCGDGRTSDAEALYRDRQTNYSGTPQPNGVGVAPRQALVNFMDNHDVSRFLYGMNPTVVENIRAGDGRDCSSGVVDIRNPRDVERFRPRLLAALSYLLTEDGIPCIYYGTEQDFRGGNDPSNRERMWETNFNTAERRADGSFTTFGWLRRLITIRRNYPALRRGSMTFRWATTHTGAEPDAGIMAFERVDGSNYALVVIHAKDGTAETNMGTPMMLSAPAGTELVDVLAERARSVTVGTGGATVVQMGPWQASVFVPRAQVRP